ncbi:competence protein [Thalassotalea loyana]|uniref:Competence protein n=1 Tax=Thalassotalea loyana TaxID=280483 RepID=A0ABQ6HE60_9GAMM|nr:phosphoribosyltransferase family protein [Thalassotalea loyana]GLX86264.1 competence protein [Thalassotalea loyana]
MTIFSRLAQQFNARFKLLQVTNCYQCHQPCAINQLICTQCIEDFKTFPCIDLLNLPQVARHIKHQFVDGFYCFSHYEKPLSKWLGQLKYQQQLYLTRALGQFADQLLINVVAQFDETEDIMLTTVPIHPLKWSKRGFNQCHEILKRTGVVQAFDYQPALFFQARQETQQRQLSGAVRRRRSRSFVITDAARIKGRTIFIFDDVLTTGSTVNTLARLLKKAGANNVIVCTLALSLQR